MSIEVVAALLLPVNNLIYDFTLLCSSLSQIDLCGFDSLMPHKASQERDIIAPLQETFGKAMAEGMRIYNDRIDFIAGCQFLQLSGDSMGGDPLSILVQKNEAAFLLLFRQPRKGFILKRFGNVYSSELPAFGI